MLTYPSLCTHRNCTPQKCKCALQRCVMTSGLSRVIMILDPKILSNTMHGFRKHCSCGQHSSECHSTRSGQRTMTTKPKPMSSFWPTRRHNWQSFSPSSTVKNLGQWQDSSYNRNHRRDPCLLVTGYNYCVESHWQVWHQKSLQLKEKNKILLTCIASLKSVESMLHHLIRNAQIYSTF